MAALNCYSLTGHVFHGDGAAPLGGACGDGIGDSFVNTWADGSYCQPGDDGGGSCPIICEDADVIGEVDAWDSEQILVSRQALTAAMDRMSDEMMRVINQRAPERILWRR